MKSSTSKMPESVSKEYRSAMDFAGADGDLDESQLKQLQQQAQYKEICEWIKREYQKCKNQIEPLKRQWYLNMAFYKGDQYVDFVNNQLIRIPAPSHRTRLVINRIRPVVRTELSRMTSQEPTAEVVPASTEEQDILAAEAAQSVFESLRQRHKLQKIFTEAAWWASVTGNGFIKTAWKKDYEYEMPNGEVAEGDLCYTAITPFHLLVPDLLLTDIEDQPYVFNVFTKPLEWVMAKWGHLLPPDKKPTVHTTQEIMEVQYVNSKGTDRNAVPDGCLIIEAWVKPGNVKFLPQGGLVTIVDDVIVQASLEGIPYKHGEYPFSHIVSVPSGSFYGTSSVDDLVSLQREFNRNRSQQMEAQNLTSKPGFFYYQGSIDPNKYTTAPGQLIGMKPGSQPPTPIPLPQLPTYVTQKPEEILRDMEDISGQHQVSKGNTPSGVTAATAIQFLQEQDNSYMATTFQSVEETFKKIASQTIQLFIQYVDSNRLIKVVGRDGQMSAKMLQGSDIRNATDIRIEGGSSLPVSKAARIALFTDWISRGIIDPQQGMELMKLPNMESYWDIVKVDENQASRENIRMSEFPAQDVAEKRALMDQQIAQLEQMSVPGMGMEGQEGEVPGEVVQSAPDDAMISQLMEIYNQPIIDANDFDNHEVHIEIHNRFRKSQTFEMLDDAIKDEFDRHVKRHEMKLQQKMLENMLMQGMAGNGGEMDMPQEGMEEEAPVGEAGNQFSGMEEPEPVDGSPVTE